MGKIRKISVGKDYPNNVIHYQVGGVHRLGGVEYTISLIKEVRDYEFGVLKYEIYITDYNSTVLWKTIVGVPVVIEDNISFE